MVLRCGYLNQFFDGLLVPTIIELVWVDLPTER